MKKHRFRDPVEKLHRERLNGYPDINTNPELKAAYHSLQLHWLSHFPEYREMISKRVSEAAKRAEHLSRKIDKYHEDVDYLGQDIEGCG